jgi:predicted dienelactone hydrolase
MVHWAIRIVFVAGFLIGGWCSDVLADEPAPSTTQAADSKVGTIDEDWVDAARGRTVPVRIDEPKEFSGPRPIVIVSHGLGGSRDGLAYFGRALAADGYVVVHLQHVGSDESVWKGKDAKTAQAALKAAASPQQFQARIVDVKFAIDELQRRNKQTDWPLHGRLDLSRIAMAGHSFGAITTQAICGQTLPSGKSSADPRVKAGIALSPSPPGGGDPHGPFVGIHIPMLFITGTKDDAPAFASKVKAADRRSPFDAAVHSNRYLIILDGADHMVFNGPTRFGSVDPKLADQWLELVGKASAAFLDATLLDDAAKRKYLDDGGLASDLKGVGTLEHRQPGQ